MAAYCWRDIEPGWHRLGFGCVWPTFRHSPNVLDSFLCIYFTTASHTQSAALLATWFDPLEFELLSPTLKLRPNKSSNRCDAIDAAKSLCANIDADCLSIVVGWCEPERCRRLLGKNSFSDGRSRAARPHGVRTQALWCAQCASYTLFSWLYAMCQPSMCYA